MRHYSSALTHSWAAWLGTVGLYRCRELDVTCRIELEDKDRLLMISPAGTYPLQPVFEDGFRWEEERLVFERGREGRVSGFELAPGRARNSAF